MSEATAAQPLAAARVAFTPPLHAPQLFGHLAATAVPGVEAWTDGALVRSLALPGGPGVVRVAPPGPDEDAVVVALLSGSPADLPAAVAAVRWWLDLDVDPAAVDPVLVRDAALAPLVAAGPGRRVPRSAGAAETAVRAVLGQQVSTAAARTHTGRLVAAHGTPLPEPVAGVTHLFPTPEQLTAVAAAELALPRTRQRTLLGLVAALAEGLLALPPGRPAAPVREEHLAALRALPGVGPWTASTVALRGLGDDDAFLPGDLGALAAARDLGLADDARALERRSSAWSPVRGYALQHLWGALPHPINALPVGR
ncbi:DNA-3-methyladenine glycosylase [uncultured Pseudokineococcus sp.]|uniref:DNA-3-methyladenine glycosylase family protein n=1 Tax=uncultured Pseudokineococcus sp. TaxID=1642928 RepID=UPI0026108800|nr:AlkA N-terminal domain-containing protein [uncultured Pseudokineococcus sp.]